MTCLSALARQIDRFARDESGPTATEYAVMLALIILVAAATIQSVGSRMLDLYNEIDAHIVTDAG